MSVHLRWAVRACTTVVLLACMLPVFAQTRAWLDREQVTYGETATLNIETGSMVQKIDYAPLTRQFDIAGQTVRRSFQRVNGQSSTRSLFAVGIRPRGPGVMTVPSLRVGSTVTAPMRLTVLPPSVLPASGDADAFVETVFDAAQPYVQQAVGMVVRLHVGVNLLSGQLEQDAPPGASLQQVGEDLQYQRQIEGRRYAVVERRYLLIPERSGSLVIPGARFNGQAVSGFLDGLFGDGRTPVSAAAPARRLQVQSIPASAPSPWLPLRDLRLRYVEAPRQARAGVATTVELEMIADGASATQLPALSLPDAPGVQVFAEPPQTDVQFVEGRPRATLRRRISIVPLRPGTLSLAGPRIDWWDANQGVARTAMLPPLELQVAPGAVIPQAEGDAGDTDAASATADAVATQDGNLAGLPAIIARWVRGQSWLALLLVGLAVVVCAGWLIRRRASAGNPVTPASMPIAASVPELPSLAATLHAGDLPAIARALCAAAGLVADDLDALRMRLDDPAQISAVAQLQTARWGDGDAAAALASLRLAFGKGVHLRRKERLVEDVLPPLYPQS